GVVSRLILVGVEGPSVPVLAALSQELAVRLGGEAEFVYAANGSQEQLAADTDFLMRHRYLLSPGVTAERFSAAGLRVALASDLAVLGSSLGRLTTRLLPAAPTGEFGRVIELLEPETSPQKENGVWFNPTGTRALLLLQTRAAGFDIDAQERALARVRSVFSA